MRSSIYEDLDTEPPLLQRRLQGMRRESRFLLVELLKINRRLFTLMACRYLPIAFLSLGAWMIYRPAGPITAGVLLGVLLLAYPPSAVKDRC